VGIKYASLKQKEKVMQLILVRPDRYSYVKLPMTDSLFWRRVENLRRAMLTAQDFEFRLIYYNQMIELMKESP
jgi:hypothetical protein